jgi:hypothetical protein
MAHVMISYASVDRPTAQMLANRFENEGFDVWFDRDIPAGQDFGSVIEAELRKSKAVVVLWSHASVNSRWVVAEAAEAASQGKLIPATVDDTAIPLEFRRLQAADLAGWHGERTPLATRSC